jgi:TonB family protein
VSETGSSCARLGRYGARKRLRVAVFAGLAILTSSSSALHAQNTETTGRKLISKAVPAYPSELKRRYIGGIVRLRIVISPRGTVDTVSTVGGNPILVEVSAKAVKKWKYVPAGSATTMDVELVFDPYH